LVALGALDGLLPGRALVDQAWVGGAGALPCGHRSARGDGLQCGASAVVVAAQGAEVLGAVVVAVADVISVRTL
jgi:hypothetical protein